MQSRILLGFTLSLVLVAPSCSTTDIRDTVVIAENQKQLSEQVRKELSYEEVQLLQAYTARTAPYVETGLLPMGKTIGQMIAEERSYQQRAAPEAAADQQVDLAAPQAEPEGRGEQSAAAPAKQAAPGTPRQQKRAEPTPAAAEQRPAPNVRDEAPAPTVAQQQPVQSPPQEAAQATPPPSSNTVTLQPGTGIQIRLVDPVSSKTHQTGDRFEATLEEDLTVDGLRLASTGTIVTGRVVHAKPSGKVKGKAELALTLASLSIRGERVDLPTNTLQFEAGATTRKDAIRVGIGAGAGAIIGAIAGGGKGAAIGTAVGGGAGAGTVLMTSGKEVEFPSEQLFEFRLDEPVTVPISR